MKGAQLVNDGLWRCLCPSWERIALSRTAWRPIVQQPTRRRTNPPKRWFGVEAMEEVARFERRAAVERKLSKPKNSRPPKPGDLQAIDRVLLAPTPPTQETVDGTQTEILIESLMKLRDLGGYIIVDGQQIDRFERMRLFVQTLLSRGHPRDIFIYECMVDAMADPKGSIRSLRRILQEMEQDGIQISSTLCQGALAALAVHPNYALRQQVLNTMREFWYDTADKNASRNNILIALLRENQYELAYDKLMSMLEEGELFPLWLYDIFVLEFGNQGFLDEMINLLFRRKQAKGNDTGAASLTYSCLDLCSRGLHYQGTSYAWNSCVKNGLVNPADGILENVLATAAREGDVSLAAEVHGMISERKRVQIHHYDALAEAFINDGDVKGAIRMLCIVEQNGLKVLPENTRAIYGALLNDLDALHEAHLALLDLAKHESVPLGVLAVILEAAVKSGRYSVARSLYQDVKSLTGQAPSSRIIEDMILNTDNYEHTRVYIDDYKTLVPEDHKSLGRLQQAYNKLVRTCINFEEWDLAIRFARGFFLENHGDNTDYAPPWLDDLARLCIQNENMGIWKLYDECVRGGNRPAVKWILGVAKDRKYEAIKEKEKEAEAMLRASIPDEDVFAPKAEFRRN